MERLAEHGWPPRQCVKMLSDLDELVLRCRDSKARSHIVEAIVCLKAGAFRAAVVMTWIAVVHDLLGKMRQLSLGGDATATTKVQAFERNAKNGDVAASLKFEQTLLDSALHDFEFLSPLAHLDLERLRKDRHRCAHPTMLDAETDYQPAPELARVHVVNAVTHLLAHGPAQGKAAIDRLLAELKEPYFPDKVEDLIVHLKHGPLGRPRETLIRNYVVTLLKTALSAPPDKATGLADMVVRTEHTRLVMRSILSLAAVVRMYREAAAATMEEKLTAMTLRTESLPGAARLCASVDVAWDALGAANQGLVQRFARSAPAREVFGLFGSLWHVPALQADIRTRITTLQNDDEWILLTDAEAPPREWLDIALTRMTAAGSFAASNGPAAFLRVFKGMLGRDDIQAIVKAAVANDQVRKSTGFQRLIQEYVADGDRDILTIVRDENLEPMIKDERWWLRLVELPSS